MVDNENCRKAFHITWVTHNSRVSERMVTYGVNKGLPFLLDYEMRQQIADYLKSKINEEFMTVLAMNVLMDHVHIVLVTLENELPEIVRKLKGYTSFMLGRKLKLSDPQQGKQSNIWARGFSCTYLNSDEHLINVIEYVQNNHYKHNVPSIKI